MMIRAVKQISISIRNNNAMKKILICIGTRPEAIKLAPVYFELKKYSEFKVILCITGQHKKMLDQTLNFFKIKADYDLKIMQKNQNLSLLTSRSIKELSTVIDKIKPDLCLVQGDTTTSFTTTLVCYYYHIPIAHIEAGLRTFNKYSPFPEEINRVLITRIADFHFAPTQNAVDNLLQENIHKKDIYITGNTVVDSLKKTIELITQKPALVNLIIRDIINKNKKIILVTGHRRENFGKGFQCICKALKKIAKDFPNYLIVYPVHLNPNVQVPVRKILGSSKNILLLPPIDYPSMIALMKNSYLILTDSGGIQEEAPSFGKPLLIMRDTTERPEVIDAGCARLIGTDSIRIYNEVKLLLINKSHYKKMANIKNPFGDGKASKRIVTILKKLL